MRIFHRGSSSIVGDAASSSSGKNQITSHKHHLLGERTRFVLFSNAQKERIKKKKNATTKSEATSAATRVKKNFSFSFLFKREREREREREFTSGV